MDQQLDREPAGDVYTPLNADDKLVYDNCTSSCSSTRISCDFVLKHACISDTPKLYENAPVSLQLVARRYRDETVVDSLKLIQAIVARG